MEALDALGVDEEELVCPLDLAAPLGLPLQRSSALHLLHVPGSNKVGAPGHLSKPTGVCSRLLSLLFLIHPPLLLLLLPLSISLCGSYEEAALSGANPRFVGKESQDAP